MMLPFLFSFLTFLSVTPVLAQESSPDVLIWVRAAELDSRPADVVLTAEDLKKHSQGSLADILQEVSGAYTPRMASHGQFQSYFIQGGKSEHLLVLLDGVAVNDASSPSGGFDFSLIEPSQLERIEIFKGSHAVRHGSQAFAGAIVLTTKKPSSLFGASTALGGTTQETGRGVLSGWASLNSQSRVLGSISHDQGSPVSLASEADGNQEVDMYRKWSSLFSVVVESFESSWRLSQFHTQNKMDYDYGAGPNGDDPNARSSSKMFVTSASYEKIITEQKAFQIRLYNQNFQRFENDEADALHASFLQSHFQAEHSGVEMVYDWRLSADADATRILSGAQFNYEELKTNSVGSFSTEVRNDHKQVASLFLMPSFYLNSESSVHPGFRYECRKAHCWSQKDLDLRWMYLSLRGAESARAPSFYQLFSAYGDANLKEEKVRYLSLNYKRNVSSEIGLFYFASSIYKNWYSELIDFVTVTNKYINSKKATSEGVDLSLTQNREIFSKKTRQLLNFSYLRTRDEDTGLGLLRRPRLLVYLQSVVRFTDKFEAGPGLAYRSAIEDVNDLGSRVMVKEALKMNLFSQYSLSQQTQVRFQLVNIANDQTPEFWGYTPEQAHASFDLIISL